jgi:putative chitinase
MLEFLDEEKLYKIIPRAPGIPEWFDLIQVHLEPAFINVPERVGMFLAQTSHESNGFTVIEENLNYSANGLLKIFRKYFNADSAARYHRRPQDIANIVYANRMGNGPESSGDGWKFRGRGLIQVTGSNNYHAFASFLQISIDECVEYMGTKEGALHSAVWYWNVNGLNKVADAGDVERSTRIINGGLIGIEERKSEYNRIMRILTK